MTGETRFIGTIPAGAILMRAARGFIVVPTDADPYLIDTAGTRRALDSDEIEMVRERMRSGATPDIN